MQVATSLSVSLHFLAVLFLVCLNWSIYRELRKRARWLQRTNSRNPKVSYRTREMTIAFLLVTVILVFLLCHSIRCILSLIELLDTVFGMLFLIVSIHYILGSLAKVSPCPPLGSPAWAWWCLSATSSSSATAPSTSLSTVQRMISSGLDAWILGRVSLNIGKQKRKIYSYKHSHLLMNWCLILRYTWTWTKLE